MIISDKRKVFIKKHKYNKKWCKGAKVQQYNRITTQHIIRKPLYRGNAENHRVPQM